MAGEKFLKHNGSGGLSETEATQSGGAGNENKVPALDASGRLDVTMMPASVVPDTQTIVASEALSAGDFVNIYDDIGTPKCRKADATTSGKRAHGFVIAAVLLGGNAIVYFDSHNNQVSGLTAGDVYLSTTAGQATNTAPTASGNIVQRLGVATAATSVSFEPGAPVELA